MTGGIWNGCHRQGIPLAWWRRAILIGIAILADPLGMSSPGFGGKQWALLIVGILAVVCAASGRGQLVASCSAVALIGLMAVVANRDFARWVILRDRPDGMGPNRRHLNAALALAEVTTPEATIGVFSAGVMPYYQADRRDSLRQILMSHGCRQITVMLAILPGQQVRSGVQSREMTFVAVLLVGRSHLVPGSPVEAGIQGSPVVSSKGRRSGAVGSSRWSKSVKACCVPIRGAAATK
jgi:hypothetical protein